MEKRNTAFNRAMTTCATQWACSMGYFSSVAGVEMHMKALCPQQQAVHGKEICIRRTRQKSTAPRAEVVCRQLRCRHEHVICAFKDSAWELDTYHQQQHQLPKVRHAFKEYIEEQEEYRQGQCRQAQARPYPS